MNAKIRLRGLVVAVLGFGLAFALIAFQLGLGSRALMISGLPGALGLMGLIELVSGYPFYQISDRWNAMHGLVRFGLGLVIIVGFIAAFW